ncbi:MAG: ABC transporter permease [Thermoanaerobaculia bacterium]
MVMTVAAIAWGTLSIVLLLSFGEGLKRNLTKGSRRRLARDHRDLARRRDQGVRRLPAGEEPALRSRRTSSCFRSTSPRIVLASAEMRRWGNTVTYGRKTQTRPVVGVEPPYGELRNQVAQAGGRFINARDEQLKRRVVFLGNDLKDELFGEKEERSGNDLHQQDPVHRHRSDGEEAADGNLRRPGRQQRGHPSSRPSRRTSAGARLGPW